MALAISHQRLYQYQLLVVDLKLQYNSISAMFRLLSSLLVLIQLVLLIQHESICFGYYVTTGSRRQHYFRSTDYHIKRHDHVVRLMAEPPSLLPNEVKDNSKSSPRTQRSKRKGLANLARRLRSRFSSFRNRDQTTKSVEAVVGGTVTNNTTITDVIEEVENAIPMPTSEETTSSRQSTAADHVDLSGSWRPIVTPDFKLEYDSYLVNCSQSFMFRKAVVNGIGYQKEIIRQLNDGVNLEIVATNPVGDWNRTLVTSDEFQPVNVTITDPDGDKVQVEAWWEDGIKHTSLLRGKPRVQGGVFETVRYLESNDVLVCESSFHPSESSPSKFKYGCVVWKFQREK